VWNIGKTDERSALPLSISEAICVYFYVLINAFHELQYNIAAEVVHWIFYKDQEIKQIYCISILKFLI